jgi:hypothetical protein
MIYLYGYFGFGFGSLMLVLAAGWVIGKDDSLLAHLLKPNDVSPEDWFHFILIGLLCLIFWPITVFIWIQETIAGLQKKDISEMPDPEFDVRLEDLLVPMSLAEIEKYEMVFDPMEAAPCRPFGHLNTAWRKFLEETQASDAFWAFSSKYIRRNMHVVELIQGYVVVRAEGIGPFFITMRK